MKRKQALWLLVPFALGTGFFFAGDFLALNQRPIKSDVIVVLGGGPAERVEKAVRLMDKGYAPRLLLSGGAVYNPWQTQAEHMKQEAEALGVPPSKILLENRSQTTLQNALYTLQIMQSRHYRSAIIVSSTFHMRRAWLDFTYAFGGHRIRLIYSSSVYPGYHPGTWWRTTEGRNITASEFAKMVYTISVNFIWDNVKRILI